jgi:hypothetical protein
MDHLPRDLQLAVIKNFDMDTRIKTGIIGKLKVPEKLKKALGKLRTPRRFAERCDYMYTVNTGTILITWDEVLEEKSIGILQREYQNYDYWIANPTQTEWLDVYEYMDVYGFVEL